MLDGNPDLYGPFWIATTVVVILFLAGTVNLKLGVGGQSRYDWGLLGGSGGLIYGYTGMYIKENSGVVDHSLTCNDKGLVPIALYFTLRWFGSESANLMECWCLYGYANLIWIPVALISWSHITGK